MAVIKYPQFGLIESKINSINTAVNDISSISNTIKTTTNTINTNTNKIIHAKKPKVADFFATSISQNVWQTIVDVTSGKGKLVRVLIYMTGANQLYQNLRVTIDGSQEYSYFGSGSNPVATRSRAGISYSQEQSICYFDVEFLSSLKVEIRSTTSSSGNVSCSVDYSVE